MRAMIEITCVLREAGFLVTVPQPARDGAPFFAWDGAIYTLYPWLHGRRLCHLTVDDAEYLGGQLGRMHQTLQAIAQPYPPLRRQRYAPVSTVSARVDALLAEVRSRHPLTESDQRAWHSLEYKRRMLDASGDADNVAALYETPQLVHGDFQIGNMLFTAPKGRNLGLIDLESFQYAPRTLDIAKAALFTFPGDVARIVGFLAGYHRVNPLHPAERAAFLPLALHYLLRSTWTEEEHLLHGNTLATIGNTTAFHRQLTAQTEEFQRQMHARSLL